MLTFLHAADFHLDSAFGSLTARQAAERRRESRELLSRMADYVNENGIQLVLLAGDLFDSAPPSRDTVEQLAEAFDRMEARIFAAPGNHDWYGPHSPWAVTRWPDHVTVFSSGTVEAVEVPELGVTVHGAAFTGPRQTDSLLSGFTAPADGQIHIGLLHGDLSGGDSPYNPISPEEAAGSGLTYLALGHIHKRGERRCGKTLCAWPGCPEGRGFDETGPKGFYRGTVTEGGAVNLTFVPFARRRYEILTVDVTDRNPRQALEAALQGIDTEPHLYRILLTGETGEADVDLSALREVLSDRFYALELRDATRLREDLWARCGEDSLRGLFLMELREKLQEAKTGRERRIVTLAARMGLAALDRRDFV